MPQGTKPPKKGRTPVPPLTLSGPNVKGSNIMANIRSSAGLGRTRVGK